MRLKYGDSVIVDGKRDRVGVVDGRNGNSWRIRLAAEGQTYEFPRSRVEPVAAVIASAVTAGKRYSSRFSFKGDSSLSELVSSFGYTADSRLRSDTLEKVEGQLARAGIKLHFESQHRDAAFWLEKVSTGEVEDSEVEKPQPRTAIGLPDPYWPEALGLERNQVLQFLRSLTSSEPIACVLTVPAKSPEWLLPTWEGVVSWAYRSAQRFERTEDNDCAVVARPYASIAQYVKPSAVPVEGLALEAQPRRLNLVAVDNAVDLKELSRLRARWPGPVYEFTPSELTTADHLATPGTTALLKLLRMCGGRTDDPPPSANPLKVLLWAARSNRQVSAATTTAVTSVLSAKHVKFKGSNETSLALSLKMAVASWLTAEHPTAAFTFESKALEGEDEQQRFDVVANGVGVFEAETLLKSGPLEAFLQQKVFGRQVGKQPLYIVLPSDCLLWAGPFIAEIASRLAGRGGVMLPSIVGLPDGTTRPSLMQLEGAELSRYPLELTDPISDSGRKEEQTAPDTVAQVRLSSVAGYSYVHTLVQDEVIWPRRHPALSRSASRSGAVLMFGPPGCGKSHLARALCGELENEARILGPADLKGLYVGWGTILVREQFDWLLEAEGRVLVIDEFDAVARSRRTGEMHADEKADVNEMLVQLDRAARAGRLVICTTNYVASLDDAAIRSGRFGHFVPVGPPDFDAGAAIIHHYLERLKSFADTATLRLQTPELDDVHTLAKQCMRGTVETGLYCGADLEEVVNRTYRRLVRVAKAAAASPSDPLDVDISVFALKDSFERVRRSITAASLDDFREDLEKYAPQEYRAQITAALASLMN